MASGALNAMDSRIVYELDLDSRQSLSSIANKLHLSVQRTDYRLKLIEKAGVINRYITVIDCRKAGGRTYFVCSLRIYKLSSTEIDQRLSALSADERCTLAFRCEGAWDIMLGTVAHDIYEAKKNLSALIEPFHGCVEAKEIVTQLVTYNYGRRYMLEQGYGKGVQDAPAAKLPARKRFIVNGGHSSDVKVDELDEAILSVVSASARMPSLEVARRLKTTPETVARRLKELIRSGVILSYTLLLNPTQYGYTFYRVHVKLARADENRQKEIINFMGRFSNMFRLIELFEVYGFMIDIVCDQDEKMREIVSSLKDKYKEDISACDISKIYQIYKFCYFPSSAFKPGSIY